MVKTQKTRKRSFGARTLSVVLALLLVLSTCVVMLTTSMFSASAAIEYWFVSGNFNNWTQEASSVNKINGSSGSVTIPLTASSIKFKMIASESGSKWCGNSDGDLTVGTREELTWNGGQDIVCALPADTVAVTFKLDVENGKNYITVTATTSGGGGGGGTSPTKYTAAVNPNNNANGNNIFWVDATYYDYLSDKEISNGWLKPDHVGTSNFNGNIDEWYPFYKFNREIVKSVADANSGWTKPLYFGNFCNTFNAYDTSHHPGVTNGYTDATNSYNVTRFDYAANNSNGVYDRNTSVQGLMGSTLQYSQLQTPNGTLAPYFNESALGDKAKIVKSSFPFRTEDHTTYKRYEFDSTNARDNVYFTWKTEGGVTSPQYVNYGEGANYGVKDGLKDFMNTASGYGIFPFNNGSNNYKGTKTNSNEELDYGFGIRMDMKFRVPTDQEVKFDFSGDDDLWMYITDETTKQSQLVLDMGGSHKESEGEVNFTTKKATVKKVDDPNASNSDIWVKDASNWGKVYIWAWGGTGADGWYEGDASSNLYRFRDTTIGSNGVALGQKTSFKICRSKDWNVNNQSGNSSGDLSISDRKNKCSYTDNFNWTDTNNITTKGHSKTVTTNFDFNPDHTYTMTIFYMERGLIESNCKMGFTITPLGNNFIVTERINTTNVNTGLQNKVLQLSNFGFKPFNNGTQLSSSTGYSDFKLTNGGHIEIPKEALPINSNVKVQQYAPANTYLQYNTVWDYYDNECGMSLLDDGIGYTYNNQTTTTSEQTLINTATNDPYDYAELQVDYENTPDIADVTISKSTSDGSTQEFGATVYLALDYNNQGQPIYNTYNLEYTDNLSAGPHTAANGRITLKDGKVITIKGVPKGARMYVVEDNNEDYTASYSHTAGSPAIVGTNNAISITNNLNSLTPTSQTISGKKTLDSHNYKGGLFCFKLDTLKEGSTAGTYVVDTSVDQKTVTQISSDDGTFSFDPIEFNADGTYRYHVYEDLSYLQTLDDNNGNDTTYASDIYQNTSSGPEFLVEITVTRSGTTLSASAPKYIPYTPSATGITAQSFNRTAVRGIEFKNEVQKGSVSVVKTDQNNTKLGEIEFSLFTVSDSVFDSFDALSSEYKHDLLVTGGENIPQSTLSAAAKAELLSGITAKGVQATNPQGVASFGELPIYEGEYWNSSAPVYQHYCLIETASDGSHNINSTPMVFTIPQKDAQNNNALVYDVEFSYINGKMINPYTGYISPLSIFRNIGIGLLAVSAVLGAIYLFRRKKAAVRYKKKH